ncbi:hypothetical protein AV656_06930 [Bhargavaea cecembensis]|uniref:Uncharacterized protein n=1 Tax=Bhargavaea cecembensis TaxID=394098 RepID=A0A165H320_9BACL|nr:hypothetical protein AV656_06930 [Bhargavaea cecembensis]
MEFIFWPSSAWVTLAVSSFAEIPAANDEIGSVNDEIGSVNDEIEPMNDETGRVNVLSTDARLRTGGGAAQCSATLALMLAEDRPLRF